MERKLPKHIVLKVYRINELVHQAQRLEDEVAEWLDKNGGLQGKLEWYTGFDFMREYANSAAESYDAESLFEGIHEHWGA